MAHGVYGSKTYHILFSISQAVKYRSRGDTKVQSCLIGFLKTSQVSQLRMPLFICRTTITPPR